MAFSILHLLYVALAGVLIFILFRLYKRMEVRKQIRFQRGMAYYFLLEEAIYTIWLLCNCHEQVWIQILPLELCSLCVYINASSVFLQKDWLRFFSGVVGMVAGAVAMIYPANIAGLYPVISYRVINFYMLHGAFILFSLLQLSDRKLLAYHHLKKNTLLLCGMFTFAFFVNLKLKTQYMFVGVPPKIGFIAALYKLTGLIFFLPSVLLILCLLQVAVLYVLRKLFPVEEEAVNLRLNP